MSKKSASRKWIVLMLIGVVGGAASLTMALGSTGSTMGSKGLSIDIACDFNSLRFEGPSQSNPNDPNDPLDHPDYGASFVVQGVIYPAGTFEAFGSSSGLLANGEPEFPELVIGRWTCRGWFVGAQGIFTPTGPFVATTQIYDLDPDAPGSETLISDGLELIDLDVPFQRAVTGGTGANRKAKGEVTQTAIGANATGLFNFEFEFSKAASPSGGGGDDDDDGDD